MAPRMELTANAINGVINGGQELKISAAVSTGASKGSLTAWSIGATSGVDLSVVALSPLLVTQAPSALTGFDTHLVVGANRLPTGSTLAFSLKCVLNGGLQSAATISVRVNGPPLPGRFHVIAPAVDDVAQKFGFTASSWTDADLPLSYQFGYETPSETNVVLIAREESTYGFSVLPPGLQQSMNDTVVCFVSIFDSYSANTTATYAVYVPPSVDKHEIHARLDSLWATHPGTVDEMRQINALASGLLNTVNCSAAPDCASLNRSLCYKTSNTCGPCLSPFIGDFGDSNSACRLPSAFQPCTKVSCGLPLKQCPSACSGRGTCLYENANNGRAVSECRVSDSSCQAVCDCDAGFRGSSDCGASDATVEAAQANRMNLLTNIAALMELEEPDAQSVEAWINSLSEATQAPDELSAEAQSTALRMSMALMDHAVQVGLGSSYMRQLLRAIDTATAASVNSEVVRRRLSGNGTNASTMLNATLTQSQEALAVFNDMVALDMLPGQYPLELIYSQFRSNIQVHALTGVDSNISATVPRTGQELASGIHYSTASIPLGNTSSADPLRVSIVSMLSSLFADQEAGGFKSNPLSVTLSSVPVCDRAPCRAEVVLQFSQSLNHSELQPFIPEIVERRCLSGMVEGHNHTCATGDEIVLRCNGSAHIVSTRCPFTEYAPVCNALHGSEVSADVCATVATTDTNITCSCPMQVEASVNSERRRLHQIGNTTAVVGYSANFVSMLASVRSSFLTTVRSADDLDAQSAANGWRVLVTVGVFAAAIILAVVASNYADEEQKANKLKKQKEPSSSPSSSLSSSDKGKVSPESESTTAVAHPVDGKESSANPDLTLIESSLPAVLGSQALTTRILHEVKHHHRWLGVVFFYSDSFPRVLRVVSLATNIIIMLFIQSLTYTLTNPDDGSCEALTTQLSCVEPQSAFATGQSKCAWDGTHCSYIQPSGNLKIILFVAIFSAIISTPLALATDWIMRHILAASTAKKSKISAVTGPGGSVGLPVGVSDSRRKATLQSAQATVFLAQAEVRALVAELRQYREELSASQRAEFDSVWGLTTDGQFIAPDNDSGTQSGGLLQSLQRVVMARSSTTVDVQQIVQDDLARVIDHVAEESKAIEASSLEVIDIGKKLLFLFQCDLLPGISGQILQSKGQRDSLTAKRVPLSYKIGAWTFIGLLTTGMMVYILLFALNESAQRQGAWFRSFVLWLCLEILVVSTAIAMLTHVFIPLVAMKDVAKIKRRLLDSVQDFHRAVSAQKHRKDSAQAENALQKPFNAAEYLFVSTRLAKKYPDIKEAQIIAQFSTPWPKQSYQHVTDVSKTYSKKFSAITRAVSIIAVFVLTNLLSIPPTLQDMVIGMVSTATIGYTALLHIQLFGIFPLLAFVPFLALCVVVYMLIRAQKAGARRRLAQLFPVADSRADEDCSLPERTCESRSINAHPQQMDKQELHPQANHEDAQIAAGHSLSAGQDTHRHGSDGDHVAVQAPGTGRSAGETAIWLSGDAARTAEEEEGKTSDVADDKESSATLPNVLGDVSTAVTTAAAAARFFPPAHHNTTGEGEGEIDDDDGNSFEDISMDSDLMEQYIMEGDDD